MHRQASTREQDDSVPQEKRSRNAMKTPWPKLIDNFLTQSDLKERNEKYQKRKKEGKLDFLY